MGEVDAVINRDQHIWHVPRLAGEVHDIQALSKVGDLLLGPASPAETSEEAS